jgi:hypothetical protein
MNKQHQDFYDKNPSFKQSGKEVVSPDGSGRLASKVVPAVTDTKCRITANPASITSRPSRPTSAHDNRNRTWKAR